MVKHTQIIRRRRIVWVCLTILWNWRLKGEDYASFQDDKALIDPLIAKIYYLFYGLDKKKCIWEKL